MSARDDLSGFTDAELAAELHRRLLQMADALGETLQAEVDDHRGLLREGERLRGLARDRGLIDR